METTEQNSEQKPLPAVRVYDIPADATAEETARIIEEHSSAGYFMVAAIPWAGVGARVFLRPHALVTRPPKPPKPPKPVEPTAAETEREQEDLQADVVLQRYPRMMPGKLAAVLATHGIVRHPLWVAQRRSKLDREATAAKARREA